MKLNTGLFMYNLYELRGAGEHDDVEIQSTDVPLVWAPVDEETCSRETQLGNTVRRVCATLTQENITWIPFGVKGINL